MNVVNKGYDLRAVKGIEGFAGSEQAREILTRNASWFPTRLSNRFFSRISREADQPLALDSAWHT